MFLFLLGLIFSGFALAFIMLSDPSVPYGGTVAKLFTIMLGDFDQVGRGGRQARGTVKGAVGGS